MEAKRLADKEGAKIIFSNPCFEIWLLWHYENNFSFQSSREKLKKQIEKLIKENYWNCKKNPNLYDITKEKLSIAQMNYSQRKQEIIKDNIPTYSKDSNPYSDFDNLFEDLLSL